MALKYTDMLLLAPIVLCSLANALAIHEYDNHNRNQNHVPRNLLGPPFDDKYTPHDGGIEWWAIGDSYTAGPDAGVLYDRKPDNKECKRFTGSYAPQIDDDWMYTQSGNLNFNPCTGAVMDNVINTQIPAISTDPQPDLVVLTIGGNDVGFGKIAKSCLVGLRHTEDCEVLINKAYEIMSSDDFKNKLFTIYDGILEKMPTEDQYQILHLGYSQFFNEDSDSDWCNDQTFELFRVFFGDYDLISSGFSFKGHRFCEKGDSDPDFNEGSTWIYGVWNQKDTGPDDGNAVVSNSSSDEVGAEAFAHIDSQSCAQSSDYNTDEAFAWDCDMARYYADPTTDHSVTGIIGDHFIKSFHPKSRGFTDIKDYVQNYLTKTMRKANSDEQCVPVIDPNLSQANNTAPPSSYPSVSISTQCVSIATSTTATTSTPASTSTTTAATTPTATCTFTGDPLSGGCQCSDGTTPPRDEDDRCCIYGASTVCFNADGSPD